MSRLLSLCLIALVCAGSLRAQEPAVAPPEEAPAAATATATAISTVDLAIPAKKTGKSYFWFRMWPDLLVKFDPVEDREVGRIKAHNGVSHGTYLSHDKSKFYCLTGKRTTIEVVDIAKMEIVDEHSFKEEGYITRVQTIRQIPGGTHWYVQVDRIKNNLDHFVLEGRQWLLYNIEEMEVEKRMKDLPSAIRRGARISPCGKKWHVFDGDIKILDPETLKEEGKITLSEPLYPGFGTFSVRGTDLYHHENPDAYRLIYTMRDPVKRDRTMFGVIDVSTKERKILGYEEWGWNPPVWSWRLSRDGKKGIGQTRGRGRAPAGANSMTLVAWDMETGKKMFEKDHVVRNGLRFAAISPDGKKSYLVGRGHEIEIFDENLERLKVVEMSGELDGTIYVVQE